MDGLGRNWARACRTRPLCPRAPGPWLGWPSTWSLCRLLPSSPGDAWQLARRDPTIFSSSRRPRRTYSPPIRGFLVLGRRLYRPIILAVSRPGSEGTPEVVLEVRAARKSVGHSLEGRHPVITQDQEVRLVNFKVHRRASEGHRRLWICHCGNQRGRPLPLLGGHIGGALVQNIPEASVHASP